MATIANLERLSDVFGISRSVPHTYVSRSYVDEVFVNSLVRGKHLVVYGGSKQGKTCLRLHCLRPDDYVVVQCSNTSDTAHLYSAILKEAGATVAVAETKTVHGEHKVSVEFQAKAGIPLVGNAAATGDYEHGSGTGVSTERRHLEIDPSDPNDVIRALAAVEFSRLVVLEDFHYLDDEVQRQVAMDLKAFHEKSSLSFMIVGVWLESNRLILYNGDLGGRLIPIDVDQWQRDDLERVIRTGEDLLNVSFSQPARDEILTRAAGNIALVQEVCYRLCEAQGIFVKQRSPVSVGDVDSVRATIAEISKEQAGRYRTFLVHLANGFSKEQRHLYTALARIVIRAKSSDLIAGLPGEEIYQGLKRLDANTSDVKSRNVFQALRKVSDLQRQRSVRPPVLDFNSDENALRVVDRGFVVFLNDVDKTELEREIRSGSGV